MIDFSTLQAKVGALKAQISQNSITPVYLGTILDEFIARMADLDLTDLADEMQDAIKNAADALEAATEAVATAGTASANSEDAVAKATEALAKANAAISAAQSSQSAAESAAVSAAVAQSFADDLAAARNGSVARFSSIVTADVSTAPQPSGSGNPSGGTVSGGLQPDIGGVSSGSEVASLASVVYLRSMKAFALKSGSSYYLPWSDTMHPMSMYNGSDNKVLKNKIFICGNNAYIWSLAAGDLVEIAADKAGLSMFATLSEAEYEALTDKDENTYYFIFEDEN